MTLDRVKFQDVVADQLPAFIKEDFPLLVDFLEQYYVSVETQGAPFDLLENIDKYVNVDQLTGLTANTVLQSDIDSLTESITVGVSGNFTEGFPETNGLIKIDNEIIAYQTKTDTTFNGCTRGFSGITTYTTDVPDRLGFQSESVPSSHSKGAVVENLNVLFLQEFFKKLKLQLSPGFGDRQLKTNQKNFIINSDSFYKTRGTDSSYKILFKALFGETVDVIRPSQFLFRPSDASYSVTEDIVVKRDIGDPLDLKNLTLFQTSSGARGTVTNVNQVQYGGGEYYQLSIDSGYERDINTRQGTIFGTFKPNPKTKILSQVAAGTTIIDVDSTVSFPETGKLSTVDIDGNEVSIAYTGKNLTQFLNVFGVPNTLDEKQDVRLDDYSHAYVGIGTDEEIRVQVTSTLKNLKVNEDNYFYNKGDTIQIKSYGIEDDSTVSSKWLVNAKSNYRVSSIGLIDILANKYEVTTYDRHYLQLGYKLKLIDNANNVVTATVTEVTADKKLNVTSSSPLNLSRSWTIENQTLKTNSTKYNFLSKYTANIQNTYCKFDGDVVVASNSLPNYENVPANPYNKTIKFSGSASALGSDVLDFGTSHGFYTGDAVFYKPAIIKNTSTTPDGFTITTTTESKFENLDAAVFYVRRVNSTSIKLSRSRSDVFRGVYVTFSGTVTDNEFTYYNFYNKPLAPQGIYRQFTTPIREAGNFETLPGFNGMFINGIELLNYKSDDTVFYGPIKRLNVTGQGTGYDIVNPPLLSISDTIGYGATGTVAVEGSLERIDIVNSGFDFIKTPVVKISGGNPEVEASAEVNISPIIYQVNINTEVNGNIDPHTNTVGFSSFHRFKQNERIIYDSKGMKAVPGLSTNSSYFVDIVDNFTIKLHNNAEDSQAGINTIFFQVGQFGQGTQSLRSAERKNIVTNVVVTNHGKGYKNKKRDIVSSGINTATNRFNITNHGYESGETIQYTAGSSPVEGLSTTVDYYVRKIDNNLFSLSEVGTGVTSAKHYFNNNILVDLRSVGNGSFNYQPITVSVEGVTGIDPRSGQDFQCKVQPVFRGSIDSIDLTSEGVGYGSSDIINFNRQPEFLFVGGQRAQATPVINNGQIVDIIIVNEGSGYISPPNITVTGAGKYEKLTPIIKGGKLKEILIIGPGVDFVAGETFITITNPGVDAQVEADINEWNVNLFTRNFEFIEEDDGFVEENLTNDETQYSHLYTPRPLRESTYALKTNGDSFYGLADLEKTNGLEVTGGYHSPILGWAYDGNPIYGPNGYKERFGGTIKQLKSGYTLSVDQTHRPPVGLFPEGFFIEDYQFTNDGDLDVHNGRFCVTPDYPEGVYAYFTTLESIVDSSGPFKNYKRPAFPYVIGNTFHARRNEFNYKSTSNQVDYDLEQFGWFRNTTVYNTNNTNSGYDYIFDSNKVKKQTIDVSASSLGTLSGVGIVTGGVDYQFGDELIFDNSQSGGRNSQAKVDMIEGKEVDTVSVATTQVDNIEFSKYFDLNQFVGFSSRPHNFNTQDTVNISGLSNYYKGFDGSYQIGVRSDTFITTIGIGTTGATGLTTYFYVSGALDFPFIRPNDILGIGTEKVKVLNIEKPQRIRVLREQEGTVGSAHTNREVLTQDSRKFYINVGTITTEKYFRVNEELYFDPPEAVGIGTTTGNGVGTVVTFRNPGLGGTTIFIDPQAIYYKNHGIKINDVVTYATNGGTSLGVWNGISTNFRSLDEYDTLYAAPITRDFIGISSHKVGLSSNGYVGIGTTTGLFFFTSLGTGDHHSFKTQRTDVLRASANKNVVTVSTASTHGLNLNDNIKVTIKPTNDQTVDVRYDDYNRRIVFNPIGFTSSNVDTQTNTITLTGHDFKVGDKVIHTSSSPAGGLENEKMYYVMPFDINKIKLVEEKYQTLQQSPEFVNITSQGLGGTISKINPLTTTRRNNNLKFDLSDSSLSFLSNGVRYPAFKMSVFLDQEFNKEFVTSGKKEDKSFEVSSSGTVGITTDANLTIEVTDYVPSRLFYKFDTINPDIILEAKRGIIIDTDASPYNQINVELSEFDGTHRVTGSGTTTFTYELPRVPESTLYTKSNSVASYITNSKNVYGPIAGVNLSNGGNSYSRLPRISRVTSGIGTNAILEAQSDSIGRILQNRFDSDNIGFDYPTDETLRPVANLPEILQMQSLTSFEYIGITSFGRNYLHPAKLVVIDGFTKKVLPEIDVVYEIGDPRVTIKNNTTGMYNIPPRIIPTENTNGVGISSLTFDSASKTVRLYLSQQFSTARDFPFVVNKNILVENISIGFNSTGTGYNSSDYGYNLFPVTAVLPQLGGSGAYIEYSLQDYLNPGETPGTVAPFTNLGRAIPEEHFPIFDPVLTTNNFLVGETVVNGNESGVVESWTGNIEQLKVTTPKEFVVGTVVRGESSNTQGVIMRKWDFNSEITTGVGATVVRGWQDNAGFLNDNLQRIPNNEYYQKFSYSLSSKVPYQEWDEVVSNLNHTAGFAKFADYQLESIESDPGAAVVRPDDSSIEVIVDIIGEADLHCVYDFDLVSEGTQYVNGELASNEIFFENQILTDYFQSIGNRVLSIDDISGEFNSNERAEPFEPIAKYDTNYIFNKIFTFARDNVYTDERQFSIVNLIQDNNLGYINEYATLETYPRLGFYDYAKTGDGWELTFNPVKFEYNTYLTSTLNVSLLDGVSGIGSQALGDIVDITGKQVSVPSGTTTTVASFPTTNRAAKILTMVEATSGISSGQYDSTEINIIHDGTNVTQVEYGDMQNVIPLNGLGLGTYHSYIDGSLVKIDFIPSITGTLESQTSLTLISDSGTTASNYDFDVARIKSTNTSISASGSPTANVISSYTDPYSASYNVVLVKDTTNNQYEMFELAMCNSSSNNTFVEYANVSMANAGVTTVTDYTEVTLSGLSPSSFNQTYTRQTTGFVLDTDTVSSGNALFHADSSYYYYVASTGPMNTSRMLIWSVADGNWMAVFDFNGTDFTEGNVSNNQAIGSSGIFDDTVTASSSTGDGRNVATASANIVYPTTTTSGGGGNVSLGQVGISSSGTTKNITYTPNASIDVEVKTFAIDLMTFDGNTNPSEIDMNNVVLTTDTDSYRGTKLDLKTDFGLTHNGNEIFRRVFDGSTTSTVNLSSHSISIPNHFFVTGEKVLYTHAGAGTTQAIGIVTTSVAGVSTDKLPNTLYVVKVDDGRLQFAETPTKASALPPEILRINSVGIGVSHVITATNQNAKALVAVDNMIQAPVTDTTVRSTLNQDIVFNQIFNVTGITSFASGDILKIDDEFMIADAVGIAGSTKFGVRRAQLGTQIGVHTTGATITKVSGNYNIVGNVLNFASAPYGNTPLSTTSAAEPDQRDWTGITTSSSFQGRTFMRRSAIGSTEDTYSHNYVFDDLSHKFNGISSSFTLKSDTSDTVGYSTDNAFILINNIFQQPEGIQAGEGSYQLEESVGVTSVRFTGLGISNGYDPNSGDLPLGGFIISVGSSAGLGYQPLVAAGGEANVSSAGTITSISIGNSGSGYRSGVQVVSVGIQQTGGVDLVPIGTATISGGNIVGVAVTNPQVFYVPRDVSNVGYTSITGITTITTSTTHGLSLGDEVKVSGIAFTCDYSKALPVNISNFVYDNVTGLATVTTATPHNLQTSGQRSDVIFTGIAMTCGLDGGVSTHIYPRTTDPYYCGSQVTAVNSPTEFETNVGVSTVPTFYQSGGVAQPALIAPRTNNHSASGSDPGSNSSTVLEVIDSTTFVINSGISTRKHFYARCGTVGKPYEVVFDDPMSYYNIPVQYSSSGPVGAGRSATVNIVVGQGSSVIDFEFRYGGYGYGEGETLTVPVGGPTGIPTDPSITFEEFHIDINRIFTDNFSGWSVGQLEVLDKFDSLFNGTTRDFRLLLNSQPVSIQAAKGSNIEVDQTLLIFINDVLQEPGKGFVFTGGSTIEFAEPPKFGDTSKILFYKGGGEVDVVFTDVLETVKVGDTLNIDNIPPQGIILDQEIRSVTGINTLDSVETNTYTGPGVTSDRSILRPVTWCKQTVDKVINGRQVGKDRIQYEPLIYPTSYLIQPVGFGSTEAYVDTVRPLFDSNNENQVRDFQKFVTITSQNSIVGASGTAIVSTAGTITSISITNAGLGYTVAPSVTIGSTLGVSTIATATASITAGVVTSVTITNGGVGYTGSQIPGVLFEEPRTNKEALQVSSYEGDEGTIVGFSTTNSGPQDRMIFDLFIPYDSFLRNTGYVGSAITVSTLDVGDFLTIYNTNIDVGVALTTQDNSSNTLSVGTTFSDAVYQVQSASTVLVDVAGVSTYVRRIETNVSDLGTVSFGSTTTGNFSWGKIMFEARVSAREFPSYLGMGYTGISTSGMVRRTNPLKYINYIQI